VAAALRCHQWQGSRDTMQHASDVGIDHVAPFVCLECQHRSEQHHAGVIEHHIYLAKLFLGEGRECLHISQVGYVQRAGFHYMAITAKFGGNTVQLVSAARAQHYPCAILCEQTRSGLAYTAAGTGDQYDLVCNCVRHDDLLSELFVRASVCGQGS
jgi:hypothetical protein